MGFPNQPMFGHAGRAPFFIMTSLTKQLKMQLLFDIYIYLFIASTIMAVGIFIGFKFGYNHGFNDCALAVSERLTELEQLKQQNNKTNNK